MSDYHHQHHHDASDHDDHQCGGDDHHHHHCEGDDDDIQCNHEEGMGALANCDLNNDPLFQKKEWMLDDWTELCDKMPPSKSKGKPTTKLVKYVKEILPTEPARILVPLCGNTPDLRWLYERGNTVVGIEGVEKMVEVFFQAHDDLPHTVEECSIGKVYKTNDDRLKIYVCDVLKVTTETLGQFDAVFDWAAYSAIHGDIRKEYVDIMTSLLKEKDYRYFVEVCHDGTEELQYGPNSLSLKELKILFGPTRKMRFLETVDIAKGWKVDSFFNSFILMSPLDAK